MESFCLPILLYSVVAYGLCTVQIGELNACWNSVYRRIFGFNKWESVRVFVAALGRLDFKSLRLQLRLKFYKLGLDSKNMVFSSIVKRCLLTQNVKELYSSIGIYNLSFDNLRMLSVITLQKGVFNFFEQGLVT